MKYQLIELHDDRTLFEVLVEEALTEGWQLQGGVSCACVPRNTTSWDSTNRILYTQAMTKPTSKENEDGPSTTEGNEGTADSTSAKAEPRKGSRKR